MRNNVLVTEKCFVHLAGIRTYQDCKNLLKKLRSLFCKIKLNNVTRSAVGSSVKLFRCTKI